MLVERCNHVIITEEDLGKDVVNSLIVGQGNVVLLVDYFVSSFLSESKLMLLR